MARADVVQLMENGKKKYIKTHYGAIDGMTYDIREGEDLNNIKEPGIYHATQDRFARAMLNCPTERAFKLEVAVASGNAFVYQTVTSWESGTVYVRTFYNHGNRWESWKPVGKKNTEWENVRTFGGLNVGHEDYEGVKTAYISGVPFITFQAINWPTQSFNLAWHLVATLPSHLRPTRDVRFSLAQIDGFGRGTTPREMTMTVTKGGNIYILTNTHSKSWYSCAPFPLI